MVTTSVTKLPRRSRPDRRNEQGGAAAREVLALAGDAAAPFVGIDDHLAPRVRGMGKPVGVTLQDKRRVRGHTRPPQSDTLAGILCEQD